MLDYLPYSTKIAYRRQVASNTDLSQKERKKALRHDPEITTTRNRTVDAHTPTNKPRSPAILGSTTAVEPDLVKHHVQKARS